MGDYSFKSIVWKTTLVHTVTYFLIGLLALYFMDYTAMFADPRWPPICARPITLGGGQARWSR